MREILFRGKTESDKWKYGDLITADWYSDERTYIVQLGQKCQIVPETIGQYTGLTDKNSKKIFEGDIAQGNAFGSIWQGEIVWIDEIAGFGIRYFHRSDPTAWENSSILKAMKYKKDIFAAEIIGNIHDNPELLKEADNE